MYFKSLVLIKTHDNKLPLTKGGEQNYKSKEGLFAINNYPFSELVNGVRSRLEDMEAYRPFVDESGVDSKLKIDIQLTGDLKDIKNVRKQLQQYGLDIIDAEREVEVLIIRNK